VSFPIRGWFYFVTPEESTPAPFHIYPNALELSTNLFGIAILIEMVIISTGVFKTGRFRMNDVLTNYAMAAISRFPAVLRIHFAKEYIYPALYERRFFSWDYYSLEHWLIAAFAVDFSYYWAHRFFHEWNIGWAAHSVHHSSEDYNLSTALRQSILQLQYNEILMAPCALLGVHWSLYYAHYGLNLCYQFWIHTELISHLGPLEYILNTPSHHRVHHGRNPFCIDKNYAGVLIIWDRLFGTFASEFSTDEKIQYGLVAPANTFNVFPLQFSYTEYVLQKVSQAKSLGAKLRALLYGPGFSESLPEHRLGRVEDIPKVDPKYKPFDKQISTVMKTLGFFLVLGTSHCLEERVRCVNNGEESEIGETVCFLLVAFLNYAAAGKIFTSESPSTLLVSNILICCLAIFMKGATFYIFAAIASILTLTRTMNEDSNTNKIK